MKKLIVGILAGMLVVGGGIGIYFWIQRAELAAEDLLPEGAVFYANHKNVAENLRKFTMSPLWKNISSVDIFSLMEKSGASKDQVALYQNLKEQIIATSQNLLLDKFFGEEVTVAFYPVNADKVGPKALAEVASSVTIITRLESEAKFIEFIARFLGTFGQKYTTEEVQYKKFKITNIVIPALTALDVKISYVKIKDFLVLGFSDGVSRRSIDTFTKAKASLAQDKNFIRVKSKFLENSQLSTYLDMETLIAKVKDFSQKNESLLPEDKIMRQQLGQTWAALEGFSSMGFSATYGDLITAKTIIVMDKSKMEPALQQIYSFAPMNNATLDFIPQKSLAYQWNNFYDMKYYWAKVKEELARIAQAQETAPESAVNEMVTSLEKVLKLNVEKDILPVLGREQGWIFTDVNFTGEFPMPELVCFIKVTDQAKAENILMTWIKDSALLLQTEEYKGVGLKYFSLATKVNVQPAYCFLNDYLFVATDRKILQSVIDTQQKAAVSLATDVSFQEVNQGLTAAANGVFFFRSDEFVKRLRQVVDWAGNWAVKKSEQMEAYKSGTKKRWDEMQSSVAAREKELRNSRDRLKMLNTEKQKLLSQSLDTQAAQAKIDSLQADIAAEEGTLQAEKQKAADLEQLVAGFDQEKPMNAQLLRVYLEQGLYPILNGLESIRSLGAKTLFGTDTIESTMYMKVQ